MLQVKKTVFLHYLYLFTSEIKQAFPGSRDSHGDIV